MRTVSRFAAALIVFLLPFAVHAQTCVPPTIITQPQDQSIGVGQDAKLELKAIGATGTVTWFTAAGAQIGTGNPFTFRPAATDSYHGVVTNACGNQQSSTVRITVTPCATRQPTVPLSTDWRILDVLVLGDGFNETTPGDCQKFWNGVHEVSDELYWTTMGTNPYTYMRPYINVVGYFENSPESGVTHRQCGPTGPPSVFRNTRYSMAYCANGKRQEHLAPLRPDSTGARTVEDWKWLEDQADRVMPGAKAVLVLVNENTWGGTAKNVGERIASAPSRPLLHRESIVQHELAHALLGVGDEYVSQPGQPNCDFDMPGKPPSPPNISPFNSPAASVKWKDWYGDNTGPAIIDNPPSQQGATHANCYKPSAHCKMYAADQDDFCVVCRESGINWMWAYSRFISSVYPGASVVNATINQPAIFGIQALAAQRLTYKWKINNSPVQATDPARPNELVFIPDAGGQYDIEVAVDDPTPLVKPSHYHATETQTWHVIVPSSVQLATNGTQPVTSQMSLRVPANTTSMVLEYSVDSKEPGGRAGDPYSIVVGFANSAGEPLFSKSERVFDSNGVALTRVSLSFKASSSDRTVTMALMIQNGEESEFADSTLQAKLTLGGNCGTRCDPCQMDPPGPGCPITINVTESRVKTFTSYDEFFYHTEHNPVDEGYFSLGEGVPISHERYLQFHIDKPTVYKTFRAVTTALDAAGNEVQPATDATYIAVGGNHMFDFVKGWWQVQVTPFELGPVPPSVPDEKKMHFMQYRTRFFLTLSDGRVGETAAITSVVDPAATTLSPLRALWKAPMPADRHFNYYADMRYASHATYKWLQQNWQSSAKFPAGQVWGQISGEHTLAFSGGSAYGTDVEVRLGVPNQAEVIAAFDVKNTAARNAVIEDVSALRDRVYNLVSGDNIVDVVRMPKGVACSPTDKNCKHFLPDGWIESLMHTGKITDTKGNVLDLTADPRIGPSWIINSSRLVYDSWRSSEFQLDLDRCRLGELPGPCNSGRPPGTGKNFRIVTQPAGTSISPGASASLGVFADGPDLQYRWYSGVPSNFSQSTPVDGGTSRQITVTPSATTTYWVYVWNSTGSESSNGAVIDVCVSATVAVAPQNQTIDYGDGYSATLSVQGGGTAPFTYRWLNAAGAVVGTDQTLVIATKQTATYTAEVTNRCGVSRASATVTVRPCIQPSFTYQSAATMKINPGQSRLLEVRASGSPNLQYRWYANGADTGVTTPTYPVSPSASTTYYAIVKNDCGQIQSQTFTVDVCVMPYVITQPEPKSIVLGQSATLTVVPGGSEPRAVHWESEDGTPMGGGTTITVTPAKTTSYHARISNACGAIDSNPATVTVCVPPSVSAQPQPRTISRGDAVTLSVTATGDAPLSYQWYRGAEAISGATSSTVTFSPADTADYHVVVTNGCSTTSSTTVTVTVICNQPSISQHPASASIVDGDAITLSVTAAGSTPLTYQWYAGSTALAGQTDRTLTVTPESTTAYSVQVTNPCGTVPSNSATITVLPRCFRPLISQGPQSATILSGQAVTLTVTHSGTSPFTYQWYANGAAVPDATQKTFTATPAETTSYYVIVRNDCNTATSQSAVITVEPCDAPAVTAQPQSTTIESGQSATLTVTATGHAPLSYQWYANGSAINGATSNSYTASPAATTSYHVVVTNACGTVTSETAAIIIGACDAPSISAQPQSVAINAGQQATVRVTAAGTAPLSYQWYANGAAIPGANGAAYTVTPPATTTYTVVVRNACGTVTSDPATVTVNCVAPTMGLQPQSSSIEPGQSVRLIVTANGLQPFSYQWYANGAPVPNSNSSDLTVSPSSTTDYTVVVSNACGSTTSNTARITVQSCIPAQITTPPADVSIAPGGSATLSVQSAGSQPRSYEWRDASGALVGTSSSVSVSPSQTTAYTIRVSNACGSDTHTVTVSVVDCPLPAITFQPKSFEVWEGNPVVLEVVASSATTLSYQWYANSVLMPGKTSRAIDVSPATVTTSYYVKVTNACGTVQSNTAVMTVKPCTKPQIASHPHDVTIIDGESATISVVASGTAPLHYTLIQGDLTWAGENDSGVFSVKPPVVAPATWDYWVIVSNGCGSVMSNAATVTIRSNCTPPSVTTQPQNVTIAPGQSATLTISASGSTPQTIQWFTTSDVQVGSGAQVTVSPSSTTSYYARVTNACGNAQSATATVTVADPCTPPSISDPTSNKFVLLRYGNEKTLAVTAGGTNLQYQWSISYPVGSPFVPIDGANGPSLLVGPNDDTDYRVRVFNGCGTVTSPLFTVRMWDGIGDPPHPDF